MPALAGPQLLVNYQQPMSSSGEWTSRIREVSPVRSRVTYVDQLRERERERDGKMPPPIIRTPRVERRSVGSGISRSGSV